MNAVRAVAFCAALCWSGPVAAQPDHTLVMPFDEASGGPPLYWLGEGSTLIVSHLLESHGATVVSRGERVAAFERLQLPPARMLSYATLIRVAQLVDASAIVTGTYDRTGDELSVQVRRIDLERGTMSEEVVERGALGDLLMTYQRAVQRLIGATSAAPPAREGTVFASLIGLEAYTRGLIADALPVQRAYLEEAAQLAPADPRVRLELWEVYSEVGDHARALDTLRNVPETGVVGREARYLTALSQIAMGELDDAFATLDSLRQRAPFAAVLNALGVVQLRRGASPTAGLATSYFAQASKADSGDGDYFFNLGYAYWADSDLPAAMYWLREAVRRQPADAEAHYVLAAVLHLSGKTGEAARERELASRLSAAYEPGRVTDKVPRGLERLKPRLADARVGVDAALTASGQQSQEALATFHLDVARRAFARDAHGEAERELRRVLYLSPYLPEAHLLLGRLQLSTGRTADAVVSLTISVWSEPRLESYLALAEAYLQAQSLDLAKQQADRALALDPTSLEAQELLARIAAALKAPGGPSAC
ncbi:MAG: tetratricopeptide repeat protein [Acidobacteriota bacterium]